MNDALQAALELCCVWLWQGVFRKIYDTLLEDDIITIDQVSKYYHVCISYCQAGRMSCFRGRNEVIMRIDSNVFYAMLCVAHLRRICCR